MNDVWKRLALILWVMIIYSFLVYYTFIKHFEWKIYQWIYLVLTHLLLIMMTWCYFAILFIKHGVPPRFWVISP